jgi:diguanylate cyclase (GGDEF)-like protein
MIKFPLPNREFTKAVLSSKKLRQELTIAFCLILLTILVLIGYLFPGVSSASWFSLRSSLPFVLGIILTILIIGFMIILQIVEPVIKISSDVKKIASGDLSHEIRMARDDELGELGDAVNALSRRIRENVAELQTLSKKTEDLNKEINNRIVMLSNLMEISTRISQQDALDDILDLALRKCFVEQEMPFGCVVLKDPRTREFKIHRIVGPQSEALVNKGIKQMNIPLGMGVLGRAILKQEAVVIDCNTPPAKEIEDFRAMFMIKNAIVAPISSTGNAYGLIVAGNDKDHFVCNELERDLLQLVSKHIAIAVLNNFLSQEIGRFEVTDPLTGLFNNAYARNCLALEVKQAVNFQKTCSFVLIKLDRFDEYMEASGHIGGEDALIKVASLLKNSIPPAAKAARFAEHEFALVLPGVNKKESIQLSEEIVRKIAQALTDGRDATQSLTVTAAVVENPIDGRTADELLLKSAIILADHMAQGGNRVGSQL